jgi:hypothetical protein
MPSTLKMDAGMTEIERLRDQMERCRRLALAAGDAEIERRLVALGNEFEARAIRAVAQANRRRGRPAQFSENSDERRKLALTNFNKAW